LIAFGGLAGLEESVEEDDNFKVLYHSIINFCVRQMFSDEKDNKHVE